MSKLKFTEEMFRLVVWNGTPFGAAEKAQRIFDEWLENQDVVYGKPTTFFKSYVNPEDTHKARLVCFEEIKKCEHENVFIKFTSDDAIVCRDCNKQLKPKNGWEIVNE